MKKRIGTLLTCALLALGVLRCVPATTSSPPGEVRFKVAIERLPAALAPQQALIRTHVLTAARMWTDWVDSKPCEIRILFAIRDVVEGDPEKLGYGKSTRSFSFGQAPQAGKIVAEQGWASLLRHGRPASGEGSDVEIGFQSAYVIREFWWDPDPSARTAPVPPRRLDALSVILHELGHALAFNGWIDPKSGKNAGSHISTYDRWVRWDGRDFRFFGPSAAEVYGGPILLARTLNNYHHLGEARAAAATDPRLRDDLMTGYHLQWAKRYAVSPLDLAILKDCGIPTKK
jgi:hypothetical protein